MTASAQKLILYEWMMIVHGARTVCSSVTVRLLKYDRNTGSIRVTRMHVKGALES